jgi:hypothetical protein
MDAFELLKEDHKHVADILEKLEPTTERAVKTRLELFEKLNHELLVHTEIEEKFLYPVLKKEGETHDIAFEAVEEHRIVKELLQELGSLGPDSEQWTAKLTVLKENIEHHVKEEEGDMFKKARKVLTKEQIDDIGARMEAAKAQNRAAVNRI